MLAYFVRVFFCILFFIFIRMIHKQKKSSLVVFWFHSWAGIFPSWSIIRFCSFIWSCLLILNLRVWNDIIFEVMLFLRTYLYSLDFTRVFSLSMLHHSVKFVSRLTNSGAEKFQYMCVVPVQYFYYVKYHDFPFLTEFTYSISLKCKTLFWYQISL